MLTTIKKKKNNLNFDIQNYGLNRTSYQTLDTQVNNAWCMQEDSHPFHNSTDCLFQLMISFVPSLNLKYIII